MNYMNYSMVGLRIMFLPYMYKDTKTCYWLSVMDTRKRTTCAYFIGVLWIK